MNDVGDLEWVNLLRTPETKPVVTTRLSNGLRGEGGRHVKVSENTPRPLKKAGVKKSRRSEVQALRSQVSSLEDQRGELALSAAKGEELLDSARKELQAALEVNSQARVEMEDQRRVVHRLSADNARLIRQLESLWQQSPGPSLTNHVRHSSHDHTPNNSILVKDLERLSQRATELSQTLATTQKARTSLEREVLALKRGQLEEQSSRSLLEEALAKSEEERASLYRCLQESEDNSQRRAEQLQLHMEHALAEKTAKLEEMLSLSERLQSALTSLTREKTTLERSLREEEAKSQHLATERRGLESRVNELEMSLRQTRQELSHMQDHQLHEVTDMKTILEEEMMSLQQQRDELTQQVESGLEERATMEGEIEATRAELTRAEREIEKLSEKVATLQSTLSQSERDSAAELSRLTARLAEVSAQLEREEREREDRDQSQAKKREQVEGLTNQLQENAVHVQQLEAETEQLQTLLDTASHDLRTKSRDLDSAHSKLHDSQMAQAHLEQQMANLEAKVLALNNEISGRMELTNEMRALLDQRANQIQELESIVTQQREELVAVNSHTHLSASHSHLLSSDSTHILLATSIKSPSGSQPHSSEPRPLTTPTGEVTRLRKQLSDSRQDVLRLETTCEEIRTELAKQHGAVQALTTIKERLTEENNSLADAKRRSEEGQRSAEEGRRRAEEGRKALSRQLHSLQSMVTSLRTQLAELQGEREEAMSQISELQEAYAEREAELAEEMMALEEQSMAATETGGIERDYLQLELATSRARSSELEQCVGVVKKVVERECDELQVEIDRCTADLCTLHDDNAQVQENCRLTAAVNAKQTNQLTEKEERVSRLLGEVEVLRARKVVTMKLLCEQGNDRSLKLELESVYEQLHHCQATHTAEVTSLAQQLRALEQVEEGGREVEGGRSRESGGEGRSGRSRDSRESGGEGRSGRGLERKTERLRSRLKNQVEQSNYLRVKLGYTLKELQLYKELKSQLDSQLAQQAQEMASLQDHYTHCLKQLQQVETLGFQAIT